MRKRQANGSTHSIVIMRTQHARDNGTRHPSYAAMPSRILLARYHDGLRKRAEPGQESPDKLATRAWASALLGFVTIPVAVPIDSVWLLLKLNAGDLTPKARKRYVVAWAMDLLAIAAAGWVLVRATVT
jgi:hypothetical protein